MNKTAIYTVITNGYDTPIPINNEVGIDYIMFTDNPDLVCKGWDIRYTEEPQRKIKILSHVFLEDYQETLYIDGNISVTTNLSTFIRQQTSDFATFKHPVRNCFIDEHYACIEHKKANTGDILEQLAYNIKLGIQPKQGMYQTGVIYRKNVKWVRDFCDIWYSELEKHTHRDQLSVMTAVYLTDTRPTELNWNTFQRSFKITPHAHKLPPQVYYFTPYNTSGNIGKAMNEHCSLVQDPEAWIAVMDGDILFPNPQWGKIVEQAIQHHGKNYELFGCVTNRVGGEHQRVEGMENELSILEHYNRSLQDGEVNPLGNLGVAGYFMLFQKKTWTKCGGFTENISESHIFDTVFNKSVRRIGGRLGLITGLYALHMYRIGQALEVTEARKKVEHLFVNQKK